MRYIVRFLFEEDAATAVEYAVMLALVLMVVIGSITALGAEAGSWWGGIESDLSECETWGGGEGAAEPG